MEYDGGLLVVFKNFVIIMFTIIIFSYFLAKWIKDGKKAEDVDEGGNSVNDDLDDLDRFLP